MSVTAPFRKLSTVEYEVMLEGSPQVIKVPFGKVEKVFTTFIANGGIINPETGEVTTDIMTLISSFKDVGNTLLTEYDDAGAVVKAGNCAILGAVEVIALFQLATAVVEDFIVGLTAMQKSQKPLVPRPVENEK